MAQIIQKIKYGIWITVSSTLLISGVMWWDAKNPAIKGEYMAAFYAALVERNVAYQTGTNVNSVLLTDWPYLSKYKDYYKPYNNINGTNWWTWYEGTSGVDIVNQLLTGNTSNGVHNISAMPLWSLWYERILTYGREYLTDDNRRIFWLDPDGIIPGNGEVFASADVTLYESSVDTYSHTWTFTFPSNSTSKIFSLNSRIKKPTTKFRSGISNDLPFARAFYPDSNISTNLTGFPWEKGNWWTQKLGYTNVYKWRCETDTANDETIWGFSSLFSMTTIPLTFQYDKYNINQALHFKSISSDNTKVFSEIIELFAQDRESVFIVVSDGDPSGLNPKMIYNQTSFSMNEAGQSLITIIPKPGYPTTTTTVYLSTTSGFSVIPASANFPSASPRAFIIRNTEDNVRGDKVGILTVRYDTYNVEDKFPLRAIDNDGGPIDISISSSMVVLKKSGANTIDVNVHLNTPTPNVVTTVDRRVFTNDLNDAKKVFEEFSRTAYVVPYSALIFENGTNFYNNTGTNFLTDTHPVPWETPENPPTPSDILSLLIEYSNKDMEPYGISSFDGNLYRVYSDASLSVRTYYDWEPGEDRFLGLASGSFLTERKKFYNCRFDYPSEWAFRSNFVSKMSIYAVANGSVAHAIAPETFLEDATVTIYDMDNTQPNFYDDKTFGLTLSLCEHPIPDPPFKNLTNHIDNIATYLPIYFKNLKLSLISTVNNPTTFPVFDLGNDSLVIDSFEPYQTSHFYVMYPPNIAADEEESYEWLLDQQIEITHFIIVVDWNFKHFNKNAPFVPNNMNNPGWLNTTPPVSNNYYRAFDNKKL